MVRRTTVTVALLVGLAALFGGAGMPQALQRLTVETFDLSADTVSPMVETPFHLIVRLRVRERVTRIENLDLPMLAQLELLGDERETLRSPRGTEYRETITLVAHAAGPIGIAPATLQAIDARDGKPKQWYTNGLTLRVGANVAKGIETNLQRTLRLLLAVLWIVVVVAVAAVLVVAAARRRRAVVPLPAAIETPAPAPPPPPRTRWDVARDALAVLGAERTRAAAVTVRARIWQMLGATEGETLGDVLQRPGSGDSAMRALLIALERSAFTYDEDMQPAIADTRSALERFIETEP